MNTVEISKCPACVRQFCLGVITTLIPVFLFNITACMSLLVNNVCFYWYYIASGFRSLSLITNIQADCHSACMVAWLRLL